MTEEAKQLNGEIKKMIWQQRVNYILAVIGIAGVIISAIFVISIGIISICIAYILDIIVSIITREKHRNASNWLRLWLSTKFKDEESE